MIVEKICPMCGTKNHMELTQEETEAYADWKRENLNIQDAFPHKTLTEREFLLSGYCVDCQRVLFGSKQMRPSYLRVVK